MGDLDPAAQNERGALKIEALRRVMLPEGLAAGPHFGACGSYRHGGNTAEEVLSGNVTKHLVAEADCDVLVVGSASR